MPRRFNLRDAMYRFFLLIFLLMAGGGSHPLLGAPAAELPPRPEPFRFVTDQAQLMSAADAQTLENGLRRYAGNTGTQIVVVTVPTLNGRAVADYARDLGEAWGVGQRSRNNGLVVLLAGQERQVSIQTGSGLRQQITPELTQRVISQQMAPSFKQGRYFTGLRQGLNALMLAANPESDPRQNRPAAPLASGSGTAVTDEAISGSLAAEGSAGPSAVQTPTAEPTQAPFSPTAEPAPTATGSGFGLGSMLIGALLLGGGVWLVTRLFRRRSTPAPGSAPNVLPNRPAGPAGGYGSTGSFGPAGGGYTQAGNYGRAPMQQPAPDFYPNRADGTGSGMGGALLTGAAAAAGAYIGNRMASGPNHNDYTGNDPHPEPTAPPLLSAEAGAATAGGFAALGSVGSDDDTGSEAAPDYFSNDATQDNADYFSADDNSSYDDFSSDDTGGGGFDSTDDNSGSW